MVTKMTRAEYEATYGKAPAIPASSAPVKMTRAEYDAKYGNAPTPAPEKPKTIIGEVLQNIGTDAKNRVKKVKEDFAQQESRPGAGDGITSPEVGFRTAGNVAGFVGDIFGNVLSGGMKTVSLNVPDVIKKPLVEQAKKTVNDVITSKPVQKTVQAVSDTYNKIPERVRKSAIEPAFNIASVIPLGGAIDTVGKGTVTLAKKGINVAEKEIAARTAKSAIAKGEKAVGEIVQGKTKDLTRAEKALSTIDTKGVKTYPELDTRLATKEKELAGAVDTHLAKDKGLYTLEQLGNKDINHVENALNDLAENYGKGRDVVNKKRIDTIIQKAKTQGLTRQEVNNISREYNVEFGDKAFTAVGEAKTSVSAASAENTRKGLKDIARQGLGGTEAQVADKELSAVINTRRLVQKQVEEVNKLSQKIMKRGLGERIGRLGFQVGNTISAGGLRGFISAAIARGQGLKTLNALDLEQRLERNLKLIQKANKAKDANKIESIIKKMDMTLLLPAPVAGAPKMSNFIPQQLGEKTQTTLDAAERANKAIKTPKTTIKAINRRTRYTEQIMNAQEASKEAAQAGKPLPVIQMGKKPKPKVSNLPTVLPEDTPKVFTPEIPTRYTSKESTKGATFQSKTPSTKKVEVPKVLYHGTTPENAKSILKNGWNTKLNTKGRAEAPHSLYASKEMTADSDHSAGTYGKTILKITPKKGADIKVLDPQGWTDTLGRSSSVEQTIKISNDLKKQGYDLVIDISGEHVILNPSKFEFSKLGKTSTPINRYSKK